MLYYQRNVLHLDPKRSTQLRTFRIALAQINSTVGDLEGNTKKIINRINEARESQVDLIAFPELALPGYPPEDLLLKSSFIRGNRKALDLIIDQSSNITIVLGFVDTQGDELFNAAALIWNKQLVDVYHKIHLPNYGVFDEKRYFRSGRICPVYSIRGLNVGVNICEDIWYAIGPIPIQREAGAELIVNINGSPYQTGKGSLREEMLANRATDNGVYIAYVNMVGGQDELVFDGASLMIDPKGRALAKATQFEEDLLIEDIDGDLVLPQSAMEPKPSQAWKNMLQTIGVAERIHINDQHKKEYRRDLPKRENKKLDPIEEIYHALVLGTHDYVTKNGFSKVLVSLSGGIDSSITCCIAVDALGKDNVQTVAMPSRYSSEGSITDSKKLVDNLGIPLWILPIESPHSAFEKLLEPYFSGTDPNVAEQNLQARIRGNLLMAISNKFGWLVLTTGNKSEYAMGYATLYGDMAGGFGVIKDVPKTLIYQLSNWRNNQGIEGIIPKDIITKPPSAELKPDQLDEDELPPYALLDQILFHYVEKDRSLDEIRNLGFPLELVKSVMQAVDRNEYKRRQSPVGIKITAKAFGRDRRMPIVNRYKGV